MWLKSIFLEFILNISGRVTDTISKLSTAWLWWRRDCRQLVPFVWAWRLCNPESSGEEQFEQGDLLTRTSAGLILEEADMMGKGRGISRFLALTRTDILYWKFLCCRDCHVFCSMFSGYFQNISSDTGFIFLISCCNNDNISKHYLSRKKSPSKEKSGYIQSSDKCRWIHIHTETRLKN